MADLTPEEMRELRKQGFEDFAAVVAGGADAAEALERLKARTRDVTAAILAVPGAAGKTIVAIGGLKAEAALLEGGFQKLAATVGGPEGVTWAVQMVAKAMDVALRPTTELANRQFTAATSFNKAASAAGEFDKKIFDSVFALRQFGVDGDEFNTTLLEMYSTVTELGLQGITPTQQRLVELAAILAEVGVPVAESAKSIQELDKVFGQTNQEIETTMLGFDAFAESIGMSAGDVVTNFASQAPYLALFGDEGVDSFERLQLAAKTSGLEMSKMVNIAESFDTFEGAAKQVGSLNALLGGPYLNSLELVRETDPTKRMMLLQQAFRASGRSIEDMEYFQKKAFISMIDGIDNASELTKFMNADFDEMALLIGAATENAGDMAEEVKKGMMPGEQAEVLGLAALSLESFGEQLRLINEVAFSDTLKDAESLRANLETLAGPILESVGKSMRANLEDPTRLSVENLLKTMGGAGAEGVDYTGMVAGAVAERGTREALEIVLKVGEGTRFEGYLEGISERVVEALFPEEKGRR
tara:strand:- start:1855 stop:3444 length:1590 start_codon:yes stop_codon:yes gene_type:complete